MKIKDVMTRRVAQIDPAETVALAAKVMKEQRASLLVVVDESGRPHGTLTEWDIILGSVALGLDPKLTLVQDVMTLGAFLVLENAEVRDAVSLMSKHETTRLLITDGGGNFSGMIVKDEVSNVSAGELIAGRLCENSRISKSAAGPGNRQAMATIARRLGLGEAKSGS